MQIKKSVIIIIVFFIGGFAVALYADSQGSPLGLLIAAIMMAFGIKIANLRIAYEKNKQYSEWIDGLTSTENGASDDEKTIGQLTNENEDE